MTNEWSWQENGRRKGMRLFSIKWRSKGDRQSVGIWSARFYIFLTSLIKFRKLENFEVDEEAQKEHLMDLEQIEQMLDNQFGTVQSRRGRETEQDGSDAEVCEEEEEDFQCIVCEKSFKSKFANLH
jgi:hypothetical protein